MSGPHVLRQPSQSCAVAENFRNIAPYNKTFLVLRDTVVGVVEPTEHRICLPVDESTKYNFCLVILINKCLLRRAS